MHHNKNVIIGLGTGRCGTVSLTNLLNSQDCCVAEHESNAGKETWGDNFKDLSYYIDNKSEKYVCEVSFYNLPYTNQLIAKYDNVKFVILKRDRQEVIDSYMKKTSGRNHLQLHDGTHYKHCVWDSAYPKFKEDVDKAGSIGLFWDMYYNSCADIDQSLCYNMNTDDLNDEVECLNMLNFCGFKTPIYTKYKSNQFNKK